MARWQPDARQRLEAAAWELFAEAGFAETTVHQITARAGLTPRTFFRYFADKREVLFADDAAYLHRVGGLARSAPPDLAPMDLMRWALPLLAQREFEGRRDRLRARQAIVRADEGLRERDLLKQAALVGVVEGAVQQRGASPTEAALAARISVAVFSTALSAWLQGDDGHSLAEHVEQTLAALDALTG